ncbi:MAG: elongation factor P [Bacilli bacterium]|nr:elongation factor P [Bacilli bacterium]MDD4809407.1 elongation factor P [Bacilli bacterium]
MINVNDIKNGMTIILDGNIYLVIEFLHVKPGKGPAFVRTKLKNLRSGATIEHTFNAGIKLEKATIKKVTMQYLYASGDTHYFMNMDNYEQLELNNNQIVDDVKYLKEEITVNLTFFEGELLGLELPEKIEYKVINTEPAVKGNTATNATKEAVLENGLVVKVPLFINNDEIIIVSTSTGKYDSRA